MTQEQVSRVGPKKEHFPSELILLVVFACTQESDTTIKRNKGKNQAVSVYFYLFIFLSKTSDFWKSPGLAESREAEPR